MPVFTVPISTQTQAGSGGTYFYPQIMQVKQYSIVGDQMQRDAVTPTGAVQLYSTVSGTGTPSLIMNAQKEMVLETSTSTNDTAATRTQAFSFNRQIFNTIDLRSQISIDIYFQIGQNTSYQFFLGVLDSSTNLAALPTTARHMGLFMDTSASNNIFLSSSNGTTQVTTDSGLQPSTFTFYRLNINWTGDNAAVISLFSGAFPTYTTLVKSVTVTSFLNAAINRAPELHFFGKTLTTAERDLYIESWAVQST